MSKAKERKERRKSTARRRAETHASGFSTTTLKLPDGMSFWKYKDGVNRIDIVPYIAGKGNEYADEGVLHYERTFWVYKKIGIEEKTYIASHKTFGKADYVAEVRNKKARDPSTDPEELKGYNPKERQLFLIYDHDKPEEGIQIWDYSYHQFGKLLDSRIKNSSEEEGWDLFYYPDEEGLSLRVTMCEEKPYGFNATAIDFIPRKKPLPDEIANHDHCLDDMLVETSYEELKKIFLGVTEDEDDDDDKKAGYEKPSETSEPKKTKTSDPEPEKAKSPPTADQFGIMKDSQVIYKEVEYTVFKVSGDGTALILIDDEDHMEKAIGCDEVILVTSDGKAEKEWEDTKQPDHQSNEEDEPSNDDDWDKDWDK